MRKLCLCAVLVLGCAGERLGDWPSVDDGVDSGPADTGSEFGTGGDGDSDTDGATDTDTGTGEQRSCSEESNGRGICVTSSECGLNGVGVGPYCPLGAGHEDDVCCVLINTDTGTGVDTGTATGTTDTGTGADTDTGTGSATDCDPERDTDWNGQPDPCPPDLPCVACTVLIQTLICPSTHFICCPDPLLPFPASAWRKCKGSEYPCCSGNQPCACR